MQSLMRILKFRATPTYPTPPQTEGKLWEVDGCQWTRKWVHLWRTKRWQVFWVCLGACCFQVGGAHSEGCLEVQLIVMYNRTGRMDGWAAKIAPLGEFCAFLGHKGLLIHCSASSPGNFSPSDVGGSSWTSHSGNENSFIESDLCTAMVQGLNSHSEHSSLGCQLVLANEGF